jgi:hypothetical protein
MHRPVSATTILALCSAVLMVPAQACSPEPDPGYEDGTYAAAHRQYIEADCDRRFVCAQRKEESLTEDAYDNCLTDQAMKLNANLMNAQFKFELGQKRCPITDQCHYVACMDSGVVGFGEQQLDKVQYTCRQKVQCSIDNGVQIGAPEAAYHSCLLDSVVQLDTFQNEVRIAFQEGYFRCVPMTSCAFNVCFGF